MSLNRAVLLAGVSVSALAGAVGAQAQDTSDGGALQLEEITVTAQKRAQNQQDVPISINAFSANFLQTIAAENLTDISTYTPGLEISGVTQPNFRIRGVETSDFGVGTDPAVGIFIDGVYASRSGAGVIFFSDIERIEVLKGPQGTLFGRNTAAGAVSIITQKPDLEEFSARVRARYGKYDKKLIDGMINIPFSETVALRANLLVNKQNGYEDDALTGEDYGRQDNVTGRVQLRWEPSERTAFNLAYEFDHTDQDEERPIVGVANGQYRTAPDASELNDLPGHVDFLHAVLGAPQGLTREQFGALPINTVTDIPLAAFYANFAAAGYVPPSGNPDWTFFRSGNSVGGADPFGPLSSDIANGEERRNLDGITLTVTHELDWATFTSISAYKAFNTNNLQDEDGTADVNFYFDTDNVESNKHFYQELRLNGVTDRLTWTAGASYYWENAKQRSETHATLDSIDTLLYNVGATPGILAQSFNPADGINACESIFLDSFSGFISFNNLPLNCVDPSLPALSLEAISNLALTSLSGRLWEETMFGEGTFNAFAAFADVTYAVTDHLNINAGLRYTHDKKSWEWFNDTRTIEGRERLEIPGIGNLADIMQGILANVTGGSGDFVFDVGGLEGIAFERKDSWNNFSPRIAVDYKITDDALIYASWARGYKAGGFNTVQINSFFDNETVWNIETGFKSQWFEDSLRFNMSFWKYKYNDRQSIRLLEVDSSSVPQYLTQTEDISGKGIDLELLWAPTGNLRFFANGGYQDITCSENCGRSAVGDPTGEPKYRISFGGDYIYPLGDSGSLNFHADHSYTSARRENGECRAVNTCGIVSVGNVIWETGLAQHFTNVRVGWTNADEDISFSFFARNIFNNRYAGGAGGLTRDTFGTPVSRLTEPTTWGFDLIFNF
ncbi:TonB-dependent receptor [Kordiimonas sp. SCSIO 12603]|uniref:TonB-dependent receptor n=1 Tax=Kordiimonas sp. SCSIO 12603 TaxID=2829596 RepID=UPI002102B495|nr:TonB-dependent receptor [Kordiimonas sp. SCSIO 12603]UTW59086.1 TonB-dependent receptor [Kordiimonas sp. SCSIO 12603]